MREAAQMFRSPATFIHHRNTSYVPRLRAKPFAFQYVKKHPALLLLGCVALAIGLYFALPWLFLVPQSNHLIGRWQLQRQIRNGSRVPISGEYEFRSDYTTRKITGISSTRAGLWIIRAPIDSTALSSSVVLPDTTIITTTYRFIDPLMHHISVQIYDQQGTPDANLWPGPGIYDITMIEDHQLTLRIPDAEAGGWIVLECIKVSE
jgi:hypothetical protein